MATVQDDFEIVDMKDAPSPSPIPSSASSEREGRSYEEIMIDYRLGSGTKTFEVGGIVYYLYNTVFDENEDEDDPDDYNGNIKKKSDYMKNRRLNIKKKMMSHGQCRICARRAYKFCPLVGPEGSVFLSNIKCVNDGCERGILHSIKEDIEMENNEDPIYKIFIVDKNTFPGVRDGVDKNTGEPYQHVTVKPDKVTEYSKSRMFKRFLEENVPVSQSRLSNLFNTEAIKSIKMIIDNVQQLTRPNHWIGPIKWFKKILTYLDGRVYENLSDIDKIHLGVYALITGRHSIDEDTVVNKDFRQAQNFVDFSTMDSLESILREMDTRSAPQNYMQSQLTRNLEKHSVESKWRISLVWNGIDHKDDLDIQVIWNTDRGRYRVFYGNRSIDLGNYTTILDFDANASQKIDEPAENISCVPYGEYIIEVNNFRRYTVGKDIPFSVIIHQEGQDDIVIESVWPKDRPSGNFMHIKTHRFTNVENPDLVMSTKAASRAKANQSEWDEYFGPNITSVVPCVDQLGEDTPVNVWEKSERITNVSSSFMDMANASLQNAKENKVKNKSNKKYLSQKDCMPKNMSDLLIYMSNGRHTLMIKPRGKSPGYVTKINTLKEVQTRPYSLNHFHTKGEVPRKADEIGTARFDDSWFVSGNCPTYSEVDCIVQFGNKWFLVVNGLKLPDDSYNYPLTGGFHPGKLKPSLHSKHNYQWTYNNTRVLPTVDNSSSSSPLIGTFLLSENVELILDGKPLLIKIN